MALCVTVGSGGELLATADALSACAGHVVVTPAEFALMQGVLQPLTIADGVVIGTAIFVAWSIAFGFRVLRKSLENS